MAVSKTLLGIAGLTAGAAVLLNLPTSLLFSTEKATLKYLETANLQTTDAKRQNFTEALGLSSLKPELDAHGVQLQAVVHEILGVDEFRKYFKGDIYLDLEKIFYGPHPRWATLANLLRVSVLKNGYRVYKKGVPGNMKGEGRLLGGVYVIGAGDQGILYQHQEREFGDTVNITDVLDAAKQIKTSAKL